ncbi:hypothetical protein K466DRAFT_668150 [Polyporus arcularius HHB13444]|uniref:Protein kinase domain-containing protein n=1 Tax=Polyporus arcularius HHB13444 TaxID=1314778 RepID=A0A5C3NP77_9APHY|nr:hypothetical protein K466DRAFT_668150 [Polyporus arcularius HHB13444]
MSYLHWPRDTTIPGPVQPSPGVMGPICDPIPSFYSEIDADKPELDITLTELIVERPDGNTQVFRGRWRARSHPTIEKAVVFKVVYGERRIRSLKQEEKVYHKLFKVQGSCVPRIQGFFVGETPEEGDIAVLVMEDCGSALSGLLKCYSLDVRKAAVLALVGVHRVGVRHRDFAERNLVASRASDGRIVVRLVDFEDAQTDHACSFKGRIDIYAAAPHPSTFACEELYEACQVADLWVPRELMLLGGHVPTEWASGTAEELLQKVKNAASRFPAIKYQRSAETLLKECAGVVRLLQKWKNTRIYLDKASLSID